MLLARLFRTVLRDGALTLIDADGTTLRLGRSSRGSDLVVRLHDPRLRYRIALGPCRALGDAYVDGSLTVERGDVFDLFDLYARNLARMSPPLDRGLWPWAAEASRRVAARVEQGFASPAPEEEIPDVLYDLFLDRDRQATSGYFADPDATLEEAQEAGKQHLAAKLLLRPGQSVLDVGSGWGGLALYLAETGGVDVTGITPSAVQLAVARRRAAQAALAGRVSFHQRDLFHETGRYDRVVSVGALERVGARGYAAFFDRLRRVLADDGVAVLRSIARTDGPGSALPWLRAPLFAGGSPPALSELLPRIERAHLWVTDVEVLRLHHAETLFHWRQRLIENWDRASQLYDDRVCRRMELDLALAEVGFRRGGLVVLEIQLSRRPDAVPLTREYIYERARAAGSAGIAA